MNLVVFLASLGAALRLTRLAVDDSITMPFRAYLARRASAPVPDGEHGRVGAVWMWFVQLFECPWCIGFWASSAVTALAVASRGAGWFLWPAMALSISWLVGAIATVLYTVEEI